MGLKMSNNNELEFNEVLKALEEQDTTGAYKQAREMADIAREQLEYAYNSGYEAAKAKYKRPKGTWIPMSPDCRGYSESFKCSICGAYIYPRYLEKELDYNGCPYCFANMEDEDGPIKENS